MAKGDDAAKGGKKDGAKKVDASAKTKKGDGAAAGTGSVGHLAPRSQRVQRVSIEATGGPG